jgi:multidrug efflux pump subunit AcrA (membrane-fusion protein)
MNRSSLATAVAIALFASGCSKKAAPPPSAAPSVKTTIATSGTLEPSEALPGLVAPYQNVAIQSSLTEPADAVNVQEGDRVHVGETIAVLDTADLRAELAADLATADSDSASATHTSVQGQLTINQSQQSVVNAAQALQQARQTLSRDTLDLTRYRQLFGSGYISEQQVSQQSTLVRNDAAAVSSAQATLASAKEQVGANGSLGVPGGLQETSVAQALATRKVALAQADQIRASIAKATIVSPIDGVVVNRNLNVGEYPGTRQIFTLQQVDPIFAILKASGTQVANVSVGATASIAASDVSAKPLAGRVAGVLNEVNPGSTDFQIKVLLTNPQRKLRPGMAVQGSVDLPRVSGVRVPVASFLDDNHNSLMVVGDDSKIKTVNVAETADDGKTAIVRGLRAGSRVVSDGQTSLGDGQKVAVR